MKAAIAATAVVLIATGAWAQAALEKRVTDLEKRVAYLESRLAQLQGAPAPVPAPAAAPAQPAAQPRTAVRTSPIAATLVEKKTNETSLSSGGVEREFSFMLMFANSLPKSVQTFSGDLKFLDKSGKELISMEMDIDQSVGAGKQASWMGSVDLNGKNANHMVLYNAVKEDITPVFVLKKAVYTNGTQELFQTK